MASLFGGLDPFPAYLRQDEGSFLRSFEMGAQVAERSQRMQLEKQRVLNDTATTAVNLQRQQSAMGIEALKNQETANYLAFDEPELVRYGQAVNMARTPDEAAKVPLPEGFKTAQAIDKAQQIRTSKMSSLANTAEVQTKVSARALIADAAKGASPGVQVRVAARMNRVDWDQDPDNVDAIASMLGLDTQKSREQKQADLMDVTLQRRFSSPAAVEAWIADNPDATPEQIAAMRTGSVNLSSLGGAAGVRAREGVAKQVASLRGIGYEPTPEQIANAESAPITGGMNAVNAPAALVKDIEGANLAVLQLDRAVKGIEEFDKKYGQGAFADYVGPVDAPVFKFRTKAIDPKKLSQADRDAKAAFRSVNLIVQDYRKANFGTALTANETAAFREIIAQNSDADYVDGIKTFRDNLQFKVGQAVADHALSPNIVFPIKERFLKGRKTEAAAGATDGLINVISPNGTPGKIPASKLEGALKNGFKRAN